MNNSIAAVGPLLGYLDLAGIAVFAADQLAKTLGFDLTWFGIVMLLNLVARVVGKYFAPKTGR